MPFGILEPKTIEHVPGTVLLELETEIQIDKAANLKKGTGRHAHVVLVPQPSDDPNDPLNWPLWQRDLLLLLYCYTCLLCVGGLVFSLEAIHPNAYNILVLVHSSLLRPSSL